MKNYLHTLWSNPNYRKAILILAVTFVWLVSGLFQTDTVNTSKEQKKVPSIFTVKAKNISSESYSPFVHVRARTEASRRVNVKSEITGRVVSLPIAEGQLVKQGDTLCELAVEDRALRVDEAKSAVRQAQMEYDGSIRLKSGGYQSKTAIASAKARLDAMKANLKRSQLNYEYTRIKAPFDGVVEEHTVDVGDYMDRGHQCAVLLDLNPMVIVGEVSEKEVVRLEAGQSAKAFLVGEMEVDAELSFVGYDSASKIRTFRIEASVNNEDLSIRSGMTTDLRVSVDKLNAHLIPASLLSLDDSGKIGVRILDEQHIVHFVRVQIVGDTDKGLWVLGLPESALLITVGQEYAAIGSKVNVELEEPKPRQDIAPELDGKVEDVQGGQ